MYLFEDNKSAIIMVKSGETPALRHLVTLQSPLCLKKSGELLWREMIFFQIDEGTMMS